MVVSDDRQTITGDLVVPAWLDDAMDWAYPARSIEGTLPGWTSSSGRTHELTITAVALLGVDLPGVATLKDLQELLSHDGPAPTGQEVLARMAPAPIRAGLDTELIRRRFVAEVEGGGIDLPDDAGPAWMWWPRSVRLEDDGSVSLIVSDDEDGRTYRTAVTVDGADVTFGSLDEVVDQYVSAKAGDHPPRPLAVWATRADARPDATQEDVMDVDTTHLRKHLRLADDATEAQITEALAAEPAPPESVDGDATEEQVTERIEQAVAAARAEERQAISAKGGQVVDDATLKELRDDAAAGRAARDQQIAASRQSFVDDAIRAGKFPPARRDHYLALLAKDEDGTRQWIDQLEAGALPVDTERGRADHDPTASEAEALLNASRARMGVSPKEA